MYKCGYCVFVVGIGPRTDCIMCNCVLRDKTYEVIEYLHIPIHEMIKDTFFVIRLILI